LFQAQGSASAKAQSPMVARVAGIRTSAVKLNAAEYARPCQTAAEPA